MAMGCCKVRSFPKSGNGQGKLKLWWHCRLVPPKEIQTSTNHSPEYNPLGSEDASRMPEEQSHRGGSIACKWKHADIWPADLIAGHDSHHSLLYEMVNLSSRSIAGIGHGLLRKHYSKAIIPPSLLPAPVFRHAQYCQYCRFSPSTSLD